MIFMDFKGVVYCIMLYNMGVRIGYVWISFVIGLVYFVRFLGWSSVLLNRIIFVFFILWLFFFKLFRWYMLM